MKRIALVTGANKGIGFETVRQLAGKGYKVLLGARDDFRGTEAAAALIEEDLDVHFCLIDPLYKKGIEEAVREIGTRFGRLDILINNAGVLHDEDSGSPHLVPTSVFIETFSLNVIAVHEVTSLFWNLLMKSQGARIVNVSSILGSLTKISDGSLGNPGTIAYSSSKAALNMLTAHYAKALSDTPHKINAVHPGSVRTDMNPEGALPVEEGAKTSVELATCGPEGPNGGFYLLGERLPW